MDGSTLDPVTVAPSFEQADMLLAQTETPAAPIPTTAPAVPADKPKRRGGFPKGAKRGKDGKKVADGVQAPAPASGRVFTADAPLTGEVKDGPPPADAAPRGAPDPNAIAFVKPYAELAARGITMMLARLTRRPSIAATDEEARLMADGIALKVASTPEWVAQAESAGLAGAFLPYVARLLEEFMPKGKAAAPVSPMQSAAPTPPPPATPPQPAIAAPVDPLGYGTIPT